jgi:hypothetical protein
MRENSRLIISMGTGYISMQKNGATRESGLRACSMVMELKNGKIQRLIKASIMRD